MGRFSRRKQRRANRTAAGPDSRSSLIPGAPAVLRMAPCRTTTARGCSDAASNSMPRVTSSSLLGPGSLLWPCSVLVLGIWCSTGTLAPLAATLDPSAVLVQQPCGYLLNIDHAMNRTPFLMLANAPRAEWAVGSMLRRVLYPVLAYPLVQVLGYDLGGVVANLALTLVAVVGFFAYARRNHGRRPALAATWLLATYPGIAYWAGSPYSYAIIVPACLGLLL